MSFIFRVILCFLVAVSGFSQVGKLFQRCLFTSRGTGIKTCVLNKGGKGFVLIKQIPYKTNKIETTTNVKLFRLKLFRASTKLGEWKVLVVLAKTILLLANQHLLSRVRASKTNSWGLMYWSVDRCWRVNFHQMSAHITTRKQQQTQIAFRPPICL